MRLNIFFIAAICLFKRETLASLYISHSHLNLKSCKWVCAIGRVFLYFFPTMYL